VLLPFLFQSTDYVWQQYRALAELIADDDRTGDLSSAYRDLRLVAAASGWTMSDALFQGLGVAGGAALVAFCLWLRRAGVAGTRLAEYAFSLTMCWMVLLGPATEKATYCFVSATMLWPLIAAWRSRQRVWLAVWGLANTLVILDHLPLPISREFQGAHVWMRCIHAYASLLAASALVARGVLDVRQRGVGRHLESR
jgi:hypothetical protein